MIDKAKKEAYIEVISEGILEKKGINITVLDFEKIENAPADLFVICEANSSTHQRSVVDSVSEFMKKHLGEKPYHVEGSQDAQWILMDYIHVVVHVFLPQGRDFYQLEDLWADCESMQIGETGETLLNE
jgi:ribosome-associated protein